MPTKKRLGELFDYQDGQLIGKTRVRGRKLGAAVGGLNGRYVYACVDRRQVGLHRLIWIWHHGAIPDGMFIDHIDQNPFNNRIENLRLVTLIENARNRPVSKNNTSGVTGVWFDKGKWRAAIVLGTFDSRKAAIRARREAQEYLGYHPNHGKKRAAHSRAA